MRKYDLSNLRILVVDDNRHFIAIMRTMLRAFGVRDIVECTDAVKALESLKQKEMDLAPIDYKLDEIDGLELTNLIRSAVDSQNPRMPIIMITAFASRGNVEAAISVGVDEFLAKPLSPLQLYKRITWLIDNPRAYLRFGAYFGPDRRRQDLANYHGPERRGNLFDIETAEGAKAAKPAAA